LFFVSKFEYEIGYLVLDIKILRYLDIALAAIALAKAGILDYQLVYQTY